MDANTTEILDDTFSNKPYNRRRDLLPVWMKICCWIFMIMAALAPVAFVLGALFGMNF